MELCRSTVASNPISNVMDVLARREKKMAGEIAQSVKYLAYKA